MNKQCIPVKQTKIDFDGVLFVANILNKFCAHLHHSARSLQLVASILNFRAYVIVKLFCNILWPKFLVLQLVARFLSILRVPTVDEMPFEKLTQMVVPAFYLGNNKKVYGRDEGRLRLFLNPQLTHAPTKVKQPQVNPELTRPTALDTPLLATQG